MAYYIDEKGKKHNISNFKNMEQRCICNSDHFTYIKNPIRIGLRHGVAPTVFRSNTDKPYDESVQQGRAISFCGCICELDSISKSYKIYGALHPSQYNWHPTQVDKETGKRRGVFPDFKRIEKWSK